MIQFRGLKHYMGKSLVLSYTKLAELSEDKRLFYIMDQSIKGKVLPENLAPEVGIAFFTRFRSDFVENEEVILGKYVFGSVCLMNESEMTRHGNILG